MRSLKDKGFLELVFNWRYFYYYITTEGVAHLRTQLGIEDDSIAPVTFINKKKNYGEEGAEEGADRPRRKFGGGDKGYKKNIKIIKLDSDEVEEVDSELEDLKMVKKELPKHQQYNKNEIKSMKII